MSETKRVSFLNIFCRNVGGDAGLLLSDLLAGELERGDEMRDGEGREAAGGDVVAGARDGEKGGGLPAARIGHGDGERRKIRFKD
jgi:hypothetical protein